MYQHASVLIVEDDNTLRQQLVDILQPLTVTVYQASNLESAYSLLQKCSFDVVLLDRSLPDGDGIELAYFISDYQQPTKVVVLSAIKTDISERLEGYQSGCLDYLCKPVNSLELKAKVRMLLRVQVLHSTSVLRFSDIQLNPHTGQLALDRTKIKLLRKKESAILACLVRHRPRVVTKEQLIEHVWGLSESPPTYSTLDVYIRRLRIQLENKHTVIKTARGFGYFIAE